MGIVTRLRAGRSVVPDPARAKAFTLLQIVQTGSGAHPPYQIMSTWVISQRSVMITGERDGAVVEAPRFQPEGRGFDSRWCHWNFLFT